MKELTRSEKIVTLQVLVNIFLEHQEVPLPDEVDRLIYCEAVMTFFRLRYGQAAVSLRHETAAASEAITQDAPTDYEPDVTPI